MVWHRRRIPSLASRLFKDRTEAGVRLAQALAGYRGRDAVVLGIARGGVVVGLPIAERLDGDLDVVVARKIRAPSNPELGLGAVGPDGKAVVDDKMVRELGVAAEYLEAAIEREVAEINRKSEFYRSGYPPAAIKGRAAIVVDDGIATGGTSVCALRYVSSQEPSEVILATPVLPAETLPLLDAEADRVVYLAAPSPFYAVGQWFENFDQVQDAQVAASLSSRRKK